MKKSLLLKIYLILIILPMFKCQKKKQINQNKNKLKIIQKIIIKTVIMFKTKENQIFLKII